MATIGAHGIVARLPSGFEGRIFVRPAAVGTTYPVGQFATFPLPDDIGDFGSGAVNLMGPDDIFASLFEYGPESLGTALFSQQGRPACVHAGGLLARSAAPGPPGPIGHAVVLHRGGPARSRSMPCWAATSGGSCWFRASTHCLVARHRYDAVDHSTGTPTMELIGIYFVACGLLVAAGGAKALRPADTARALGRSSCPARLPLPGSLRMTRLAVRFGALAEAALGAVALFSPRPLTAALVAASYALFALRRCLRQGAERGALATCGCFGRPDTPATRLHVVVNSSSLAAAILVAVRPPDATSLFVLLDHQPWLGLRCSS